MMTQSIPPKKRCNDNGDDHFAKNEHPEKKGGKPVEVRTQGSAQNVRECLGKGGIDIHIREGTKEKGEKHRFKKKLGRYSWKGEVTPTGKVHKELLVGKVKVENFFY